MTRFPLQTWRVRIEAHVVAGRWEIPPTRVRVPAANAEHAREVAVIEAHSKAAVAPWRPCTRESLRYATVVGSSLPVPRSELSAK